ncbi:MAG: pyridoxamine 5'-phosphate oxidase family protein [Candidatus Pacebacteria bacterium]|nr:pyridoxamine 5'-phosphate oxidase family protein [Candidatus Paceibacterota bacterium]
MLDVEKAIRECLKEICHMSLATCVNNKPWVCEVHFVYDDDLNIYFHSKLDRRHSKEIKSNQFVAGNIVAQHTLGSKVRGVYFEGGAELLNNITKGSKVYHLFKNQLNKDEKILEIPGFYKVAVENFALFDNRESNPSQKYILPWKK